MIGRRELRRRPHLKPASRKSAVKFSKRSVFRWQIPILRRSCSASATSIPDTAFIYFPGTQAPIFAKQFAERGLAQSGIKIVGTGDLTDDDDLNTMGDQMLGMITAGPYSAAHDSDLNRSYVAAFEKANRFRPDFVSVSGYDAMHLIYEALKKTGGNAEGDTLLAAMKGMSWESPRGPISIDAETRDIVQNIYVRRVEKVNGQLYSVEFATYPAVKDPMKAGGAK